MLATKELRISMEHVLRKEAENSIKHLKQKGKWAENIIR